MNWTYDDRLIAEDAWAEYWQELQADDELIRLWEAAQVKDKTVQAEVDALIEQGSELVF